MLVNELSTTLLTFYIDFEKEFIMSKDTETKRREERGHPLSILIGACVVAAIFLPILILGILEGGSGAVLSWALLVVLLSLVFAAGYPAIREWREYRKQKTMDDYSEG